ncbi:SNF1 kinase complex beta-subunit [Favolaschia claudopus]|uniref:SNF1 kinase complex beta-subunit n=1 Tax=Favolaschia claudopus TaxID=2862362 RepID=A0AAW0DC28_9AGAR
MGNAPSSTNPAPPPSTSSSQPPSPATPRHSRSSRKEREYQRDKDRPGSPMFSKRPGTPSNNTTTAGDGSPTSTKARDKERERDKGKEEKDKDKEKGKDKDKGKGTDTPVLRPNRKSIDLPGLNTFGGPANSSSAANNVGGMTSGGGVNSSGNSASGRSSRGNSRMHVHHGGSRIVERGRTWLGRAGGGGSGGGGQGQGQGGRGRGATPPRSAAIAIPARANGGVGNGSDTLETGYGQYAREGIARRKAEEREREREREQRRGRSRSRTRSRSQHQHLRAPSSSQSRPPAHDEPSPSRSRSPNHNSRSRSPSRSSHSQSQQSRSDRYTDSERRGRSPYGHGQNGGRAPRGSPVSSAGAVERERERERYEREQLYGPPSTAGVSNASGDVNGSKGGGKAGKKAYTPEVIFSSIPLTIGLNAFIGGAEGDGYEDDEDAENPALPASEGEVGMGMTGGAVGDEGLTGRARGVAAVVDEIVGSPPPPPAPLTPVEIVWRGPANTVYLIRAGDDDWMGRREMERVGAWAGGEGAKEVVEEEAEDGSAAASTAPFTTTIHLPPGTHHFRFIVDGQTVVAPPHEIPNAVDDQGFIANYVAVPGPVSPAPASASAATKKRRRPSLPVQLPISMHPDGSFFARSDAGGSGEDVRLAERVLARRGSMQHEGGGLGHAGGGGGFVLGRRGGATWTSEIPEALTRAAEQEEVWMNAQQTLVVGQHHHHHPPNHGHHHHQEEGGRGGRSRHIVLNGFVPEPTIPPAPRLPRHLERLILNRPSPGVVIPKVGNGAVVSGSSMNAVGVEATPSPELRVTTASGTDVSLPMASLAEMSSISGASSVASGSVSGSGSGVNGHAPNPNLLSPNSHPQFGTRASVTAVGVPLIADDPSVLQTPSHAVLYHLCTSSIRDQTIAVGASTRYRQKYLTTVYYKPAGPVE